MTRTPARSALLAAATALVVLLAGCGSGDSAEGSAAQPGSAAATTAAEAPVATGPFGAGCGALPPEGEGSLAGMADDLLATAVSNNPVLSNLMVTLHMATLVDSLNTTEDLTVLAPVNQAYEAVPAEMLDPLLADTPRLTELITHHVVPGRLGPDELAGTHTTLSGGQVTVEGSGESFMITADQTLVGATGATVVCGNVQTANATVYLIDQVLTPPAD
ncbi:fasciclin domain-containing protein [Geodermatophilus sabuli]|uniref:Uncaracterized surface protein containing fasciclin (FAS1) repeats n=1 Tax=Geodermatophilus sabuli TaxID=1564158 RepID=A0A285E8Y8_9ACTN|nr:fasciclin domain-containing protein [Geodermatophilus sabuli]MBB3085162.1 putative surface protein with fasciclin (FAS1) repeats [Geodermatophilus sabuli]SNX95430.1 Uncaracterized surface protein containing fasciclin (FAS1) repeats [Geodermatophilus sabuli]